MFGGRHLAVTLIHLRSSLVGPPAPHLLKRAWPGLASAQSPGTFRTKYPPERSRELEELNSVRRVIRYFDSWDSDRSTDVRLRLPHTNQILCNILTSFAGPMADRWASCLPQSSDLLILRMPGFKVNDLDRFRWMYVVPSCNRNEPRRNA